MGLLLLPFRLVGALLKVVLGGASLVLKLVWGVFAAVAAIIGIVLVLVFLPLLPLLVLGGLIWLVVRRPRAHAMAVS